MKGTKEEIEEENEPKINSVFLLQKLFEIIVENCGETDSGNFEYLFDKTIELVKSIGFSIHLSWLFFDGFKILLSSVKQMFDYGHPLFN